jgi:hypothetical protein
LQAGRYVSGEIAEQWRASGHCETVPLQDILHVIPEYTQAHMVAGKRIEMEQKLETDATVRFFFFRNIWRGCVVYSFAFLVSSTNLLKCI